ncbi:hypothetical protein PMAYCL1PPCAC_08302, partial [Pristionchus mayeri]
NEREEDHLEIKDELINNFSENREEKLNADANAHRMEFLPLFETVVPKHIKEEPVEMKEEPIDELVDIEQISSLATANEIKEDPMEVKYEPIDDLKLEEPIIDIYCPSTGESRPIDSTNLDNGLAMDCDETAVWQIVPTENGNISALWKKCFICHNLCSKFYELPKHEGQRRAFFERIIVENVKKGMLAKLHIFHRSTGNFRTIHEKMLIHKKMKKPSRVEANKSHPYPGRASSVRPKCAFPNRNGWLIDEKICYLCNKTTDKFHSTPENSEERIAFLNRIILTRKADEDRVAALVNNNIHAYFCQIHVATRMI